MAKSINSPITAAIAIQQRKTKDIPLVGRRRAEDLREHAPAYLDPRRAPRLCLLTLIYMAEIDDKARKALLAAIGSEGTDGMQFLQCWLSRAVEDKHLADRGTTAAINRGGGWRESRSNECAETLWEGHAAERGAELFMSERHRTALVAVRVILPAKSDLGVRHIEQAVIGNRYAMRVASQIMQHMLGAAEWLFGVDDPVIAK